MCYDSVTRLSSLEQEALKFDPCNMSENFDPSKNMQHHGTILAVCDICEQLKTYQKTSWHLSSTGPHAPPVRHQGQWRLCRRADLVVLTPSQASVHFLTARCLKKSLAQDRLPSRNHVASLGQTSGILEKIHEDRVLMLLFFLWTLHCTKMIVLFSRGKNLEAPCGKAFVQAHKGHEGHGRYEEHLATAWSQRILHAGFHISSHLLSTPASQVELRAWCRNNLALSPS